MKYTVEQIAEYLKQTDGWNLVHPQFGIEQYYKDRECDKFFLYVRQSSTNRGFYSCEILNGNKKPIIVLAKGTLQQAINGAIWRICTLLEHLDDLRRKHCETSHTHQPTKPLTFAEWYEAKVGLTLDQAKRTGVYDLDLLEDAFNFNPHSDTLT